MRSSLIAASSERKATGTIQVARDQNGLPWPDFSRQLLRWQRAVGLRVPLSCAFGRGVAQPGSASAWGAGGRGFESRRPDHVLAIIPDRCTTGISRERRCRSTGQRQNGHPWPDFPRGPLRPVFVIGFGEDENWRLRKKAPFDCGATDGGANIAKRWPEGGAQRTRPKGERREGASHPAAPTMFLRSSLIAARRNFSRAPTSLTPEWPSMT